MNEISSRKEAFKLRFRNAKECLTPPKKETWKKTNRNLKLESACSNIKNYELEESTTSTTTAIPLISTHSQTISNDEASSISHSTSSIPVSIFYNTGSVRRYHPKPLSPLATCSWNNTSDLPRVNPTPFIYRSGVRGREGGSSVTPQQTPSPIKVNGKRPISDLLSPSWVRRKKIKSMKH